MNETVLYVLAQAAHTGELELATAAARVADPLVRPFVKSAVRASIQSATKATKVATSEHVLRLAFLLRAGKAPSGEAKDDEVAVNEAFDLAAKPYEEERK